MPGVDKRHAFTLLDDIQRHQQGCSCGRCDKVGRSFGVSIRLMDAATVNGIEDAIHDESSVALRVHGPSTAQARQEARAWIAENCYEFAGEM